MFDKALETKRSNNPHFSMNENGQERAFLFFVVFVCSDKPQKVLWHKGLGLSVPRLLCYKCVMKWLLSPIWGAK